MPAKRATAPIYSVPMSGSKSVDPIPPTNKPRTSRARKSLNNDIDNMSSNIDGFTSTKSSHKKSRMVESIDERDSDIYYEKQLGILNKPGDNYSADNNRAPLNPHQRLVSKVASSHCNDDSGDDVNSDDDDVTRSMKLRKRYNNQYFTKQSYKQVTSDNTLDMMNLITAQQRLDIIGSIPPTNQDLKRLLVQHIIKECYPLWKWVLACTDNNVLLHGYGSKKIIMNYFVKQQLSDSPCVVVNGYFPNLSLLSVIKAIITDILKQDSTSCTTIQSAYNLLRRLLCTDDDNSNTMSYDDDDSDSDDIHEQQYAGNNDVISDIDSAAINKLTPTQYKMYKAWNYANHSLIELHNFIKEYTASNIIPAATITQCIIQLIQHKIQSNDVVTTATRQHNTTSSYTPCTAIRRTVKLPHMIVILVNSLDGVALRTNDTQNWLSDLASLPRIKMICSVDHIHSQLLISAKRIHKYNFVTLPCSTYADYTAELVYDDMTQLQSQNDQVRARGITHVLISLTPRHVAILKQLATLQLHMIELSCSDSGGKSQSKFSGVPHSEWISALQDNMLWSNDTQFKQYLQEFITHGLLVVLEKRYSIPYSNDIIQQHIIDNNSNSM